MTKTQILEWIADMGAFHIPPVLGNLGDALIHYSLRRALDDATLSPVPESDQTALLFPGGGNLIPLWNSRTVIDRWDAQRSGLILPHSMRGVSALLRDRPHITVIAREQTSYDYLVKGGVPPEQVFVSDDVAMWLAPWVASVDWGSSSGVLIALRTDAESTGARSLLTRCNFDVSRQWTSTWLDAEETTQAALSFLRFLAGYDSVVTDRLHVALAAAMLNKQCFLLGNSYGKNRSVYDFSLRDRFPAVRWCESFSQVPRDVLHQAISRAGNEERWSNAVGGPSRLEFPQQRGARIRARSVAILRRAGGGLVRWGADVRHPEVPLRLSWPVRLPVRVRARSWNRWAESSSPGGQLVIAGYWRRRSVRAAVDALIAEHPGLDCRRVGQCVLVSQAA